MVVLFEDSAAVLGVFIAASGILLAEWTGNPRWDGAASMSIGVLLAVVAFLVAYEVKSLLVGESASRQVRSEIRAAVLSHSNVKSIGRLLTMHMGPQDIVVNLDVDFQDGISLNDVERSIDEIEASVREVAPQATQIFVEVESAR